MAKGMNFEEFMVNTFTIQSLVRDGGGYVIPDELGGVAPDYADLGTDYTSVPCSLQPIGGSKVPMYAGKAIEATHRAYFGQALELKIGDIGIDENGVKYEVAFWEHQGGVGGGGLGTVFAVYLKDVR